MPWFLGNWGPSSIFEGHWAGKRDYGSYWVCLGAVLILTGLILKRPPPIRYFPGVNKAEKNHLKSGLTAQEAPPPASGWRSNSFYLVCLSAVGNSVISFAQFGLQLAQGRQHGFFSHIPFVFYGMKHYPTNVAYMTFNLMGGFSGGHPVQPATDRHPGYVAPFLSLLLGLTVVALGLNLARSEAVMRR